MDIRITKKRLKNLINYDWIIALFTVIGIGIFYALLLTIFATRLTTGQTFNMYVFNDVVSSNNANILNTLKQDGVFSYDIKNCAQEQLVETDQYSATYLLSARTSTHEADVVIVNDGRAINDFEGENEEDFISDLQVVINSREIQRIDGEKGLIYRAELYISKFKDSDGNLREDKIRDYFISDRCKSARNYRRTYNSESSIEQGVKDEIERIKYLDGALTRVKTAIENAKADGNDFLWYGESYYEENNGERVTIDSGAFGIDLYKLNLNYRETKDISNLWYLRNGETATTEGLVLCTFNFEEYQPDLHFETVSFIDYLIREYSDYAD